MRIRRWRKVYLGAEYAALFFGGTTAYNAILRGKPPIPALLILASGAALYLRRSPGFDRAALWRASAFRDQARSMALSASASAAALTAAVALRRREDLFDLPRRSPALWLAVMVLYPALSVYPQELVFRSFLFHRYAPVFGDGTLMVAASAAAFGYVHIIFGSWFSVIASGAAWAGSSPPATSPPNPSSRLRWNTPSTESWSSPWVWAATSTTARRRTPESNCLPAERNSRAESHQGLIRPGLGSWRPSSPRTVDLPRATAWPRRSARYAAFSAFGHSSIAHDHSPMRACQSSTSIAASQNARSTASALRK